MKSENTSKRLAQYMKISGDRQIDILRKAEPFAAAHGVKMSKSDISQYLSGKAEPKQDKIYVLACALGVSEAWLMGYDVPMERKVAAPSADLPSNILPLPRTRKVPLLGTIACGEPILATENIDTYVDVPEEIRCDFTLRCKGDSMIGARIYDGDIVYIREQPDVENGEIAAVLIDGSETEATLKRVYKSDGQIMLMPENSAYQPMMYAGADMARVRILGKAVAFTSMVR